MQLNNLIKMFNNNVVKYFPQKNMIEPIPLLTVDKPCYGTVFSIVKQTYIYEKLITIKLIDKVIRYIIATDNVSEKFIDTLYNKVFDWDLDNNSDITAVADNLDTKDSIKFILYVVEHTYLNKGIIIIIKTDNILNKNNISNEDEMFSKNVKRDNKLINDIKLLADKPFKTVEDYVLMFNKVKKDNQKNHKLDHV